MKLASSVSEAEAVKRASGDSDVLNVKRDAHGILTITLASRNKRPTPAEVHEELKKARPQGMNAMLNPRSK